MKWLEWRLFRARNSRHTFATRFHRAPKDIELLGRFLGHVDLKMLLRYVHIDEDNIKTTTKAFQHSPSSVEHKEVIQRDYP